MLALCCNAEQPQPAGRRLDISPAEFSERISLQSVTVSSTSLRSGACHGRARKLQPWSLKKGHQCRLTFDHVMTQTQQELLSDAYYKLRLQTAIH